MIIRAARAADAETLVGIYAPYVRTTAVSFETEVPSVGGFAERIARVMEMYPYLVAEERGEAIGYAYASRFRARAAYDWAAESSIYVRMDARRTGAGTALYDELERLLRAQGVLNLYAGVTTAPGEDAHLPLGSFAFHEKLGFRLVGEYRRCGCKFGKWYGVSWFEKFLGEHNGTVTPVRAITKGDYANG